MNRISFSNAEDNDKSKYAQAVQSNFQNMTRYRNYNWKMYNFVKSAQENVILERKSTYVLCVYKDKLKNACPADIKMLKQSTWIKSTSKCDLKPKDTDFEEYEADLDVHHSDLAMESQKLRTWDEYKKLLESSRLKPRAEAEPCFQPILTDIAFLPKIRIDEYLPQKHLKSTMGHVKLRRRTSTRLRKSIMRTEPQETILVANSNYVQFRNFKLKKVYMKKVTLQNVNNMPARFQMRPRPYRSKFRIIMEPMMLENSGIIAPGMQMQLIILFRCDDIDSPQETLVLNVQHGKSVIIRLHAYKDSPTLLGICMAEEMPSTYAETNAKSLDHIWYPDTRKSFDGLDCTLSSGSDSVLSSETEDDDFVSMTFDCKKAFVGEEVYRSIKFKNIGGEGRFFVMSEMNWLSMDIMDILETNTLRLTYFTIQPAYFSLKRHQDLTFHMYFSPGCYGIHVEQLYILCDNCTLLPTEIIGDGLLYEPHLIQLSKQFEKVQPLERNIDKQAKYYVKLSTNTSDGIEQCIISVNNYSEIGMHFHWKKRNVKVNSGETIEENFPLELVHIKPDQGMFAPNSAHYFTLTAEYKDLQPNYYFTVLELYVEDIPIEAIVDKTKLRTHECFTKRRKCSTSVDIWIADVEICLQYMMHDEGETYRTTDEIFKRVTEIPSYYEYAEQHCYEEGRTEEKETKRAEEEKEHKFMYQLVVDELFSHYDIVIIIKAV
ncbi:unnamed protein product [Xylocopa violacea]|uniref:HYDIN/VesB/CFA65-like Ig-like domain-containing protein n=1 Tax=Xylocopa violacea TaxID=135666 RepID=A0ABP1N7J6_XYLVO